MAWVAGLGCTAPRIAPKTACTKLTIASKKAFTISTIACRTDCANLKIGPKIASRTP